MKPVLQRIDAILARIPADSRSGRKIHGEMVDHLGDAVAARVAEGEAYEAALEHAVDDFGPADELEPAYYRDYVRSRYLLGFVDREAFGDGRLLRSLGITLLLLGVLCYQVLPTVAAHAGSMALVHALLTSALQDPGSARGLMETAVEQTLPFELDPRLGAVRPWGVVMGVGLLLFVVAGARSLRRLRMSVSGAELLLLGLLGAGGAVSLLTTVDPSRYALAFIAGVFLPVADDPARDGLEAQGVFAWWTSVAVVAGGVWIWFRAWRAGVADTFLLRQGAFWLLVLALSIHWMSHPLLRDGLLRMAEDPDAIPPAQIHGLLTGDLTRFVAGSVGLVAATLGLGRVFAAADRVFLARGG